MQGFAGLTSQTQAFILARSGVLTGEALLSPLPITGITAAALFAGMFIRKKSLPTPIVSG
jgi:hypothetical protein